MNLVSDAAGVAAVVAEVRGHGRAALDFEFMWERTYAPLPCLAQIATASGIHLVDPIAGAPLGPIGELIADPGVSVVMHAPSADLILMELAHGTRPAGIEDVQLMAGFAGRGAGQGLANLLEGVLGVALDKSERYTDWSRRPLGAGQLEYAAADVRHLIELADVLWAQADRLGRRMWVEEELRLRYTPAVGWAPAPEEAWKRVKGHGRLRPPERAVLAELAAWRERRSAEVDRPVNWVIPDRTLVEIARRRPRDVRALRDARGMPERIRDADAADLVAAVERGVGRPPISLEPPPSVETQARLDVLGPLAQVVVSARAGAAELAPSLLATRGEITAYLIELLEDRQDGSPLAGGWRRELAGEAIERLAAGRLALAPTAEPPYVEEIPRP